MPIEKSVFGANWLKPILLCIPLLSLKSHSSFFPSLFILTKACPETPLISCILSVKKFNSICSPPPDVPVGGSDGIPPSGSENGSGKTDVTVGGSDGIPTPLDDVLLDIFPSVLIDLPSSIVSTNVTSFILYLIIVPLTLNLKFNWLS
mgnify:CR=1 FL=1